jgi:hypothetical protein
MSLAVVMSLSFAWGYLACDGTAPTAMPRVYTLHIESQPLDAALQDLARQTSTQVLVFSRLTAGRRSAPLHGMYTLDAAMAALLSKSKLTYRLINAKTIEVVPERAAPHRH